MTIMTIINNQSFKVVTKRQEKRKKDVTKRQEKRKKDVTKRQEKRKKDVTRRQQQRLGIPTVTLTGRQVNAVYANSTTGTSSNVNVCKFRSEHSHVVCRPNIKVCRCDLCDLCDLCAQPPQKTTTTTKQTTNVVTFGVYARWHKKRVHKLQYQYYSICFQ